MSYSKDDYYKDVLSKSFDENGITATSEQIDDVVTDIVVSVANQWIFVYEQPEHIAATETPEQQANANLFAAAPALLRSAIEVCEAWGKFIDSFDYVPGIGDTAEDIEFQEMMRLRIAINEATQ